MEGRLNNLKKNELALFNYNKTYGFKLIYLLPVIIIATIIGVYFLNSIKMSYFLIITLWVLYLLNTLAIFFAAITTRKSFLLEQEINRRKGLPFDSLQGFDVIEDALDSSMQRVGIICMVVVLSLAAYLVALIANILPFTYAAAGLVFISLGLAIWIKPVNFTTSQTMGLIEIYEPQTHPIYMDYIFTEFAQTFMDPSTVTKFDEYTAELEKSLKKGVNIAEAREKIFYCIYLLSSDVISEEVFKNELLEIIEEDSYKPLIEEHEIFKIDTLLIIMNKIKEKVPSFIKIIDRIQFNLIDNLSIFKNTEIYLDAAVRNIVRGKEVDIVVMLFNNTTEPKEVRLKVIAPDFEPVRSFYRLSLAERNFDIENDNLVLSSSTEQDVIECQSKILDTGDILWIPLTAKDLGKKRINIYLEDEKENIIKAINIRTELKKDTFKGLRKATGGGSMGAGILAPLLKSMGALPGILDKLKIG